MPVAIFGNYLKKKRERAKLTLLEIGVALGYSNHQYVWNWENGKSLPPTKVINKLAKLLNCSAEELLEVRQQHKIATLRASLAAENSSILKSVKG